MGKTYRQLTTEIEKLQREAEALKAKEMQDVIGRVKEAIAAYGLTAADLGLTSAKRSANVKKTRRKSATRTAPSKAKYADGAGNTWVGRGKRPVWLQTALAAGRKLEDFLVKG